MQNIKQIFSWLTARLSADHGNGPDRYRFQFDFTKTMVLFSISAVMALILGFGMTGILMIDKMFAYGTYYFFWVTFILLFSAGSQGGGQPTPFAPWSRCEWFGLTFLAVGITAVIFSAVGIDFRVLADENNLISTSRSLFINRSFYNLMQGEPYYGFWTTLESALPVRPGGYPFLINILHSLRGFSPYHGFVVNFATGVGLMLVMTRFGENLVRRPFGLIAAGLLASFPLYQLVVTSSGYDALNLLGIMVVLWQLHGFIVAPSAHRLEMLVLCSILAGQVRYESILLLVPIGLGAIYHLRTLRQEKYSFRCVLLPLLLLPIAWQRAALGMNALLQDDQTEVFATRFLAKNLRGMYNLFLDFNQHQLPRSEIFVGLGILGIAMMLLVAFRRRLSRTQTVTIVLASTALIPLTTVQLLFYNGDVSTAFAVRMAMVYLVALSFFAAYPLWWLLRRGLCRGKIMALIVAAIFLHELPVAAHNDLGKSLTLFREFKNIYQLLEKRPHPLVVVADRPVLYVAMGYGAVNFSFMQANTAKFKHSLKMHLYDVYAVLSVPEDKPPTQLLPLEDFRLETIGQWQNEANITIRLVQLFPLDTPKEPPALAPELKGPCHRLPRIGSLPPGLHSM